MNLFEIDYLAKLSSLMKEAFHFKKYRAMHPALAVICGIAMIPFVLLSFALAAYFALLSFIFKAVRTPIDFLHGILKSERSEVKSATQFILYFFSWPIIFFLYAFLSYTVFQLTVAYALLSAVTYVWTLGGFKFHLFVDEAEDISVTVSGRYKAIALIYVIISLLILVVAPCVHGVLKYADLYADYLEDTFTLNYYFIYLSASAVFSLIYSLVGFAKNPKPKDEFCPETRREELVTEEID